MNAENTQAAVIEIENLGFDSLLSGLFLRVWVWTEEGNLAPDAARVKERKSEVRKGIENKRSSTVNRWRVSRLAFEWMYN